jgi:hypothetical protein
MAGFMTGEFVANMGIRLKEEWLKDLMEICIFATDG